MQANIIWVHEILFELDRMLSFTIIAGKVLIPSITYGHVERCRGKLTVAAEAAAALVVVLLISQRRNDVDHSCT